MGDGGIGDVFVLKEDSVGNSFHIIIIDSTDMVMVLVRGGV